MDLPIFEKRRFNPFIRRPRLKSRAVSQTSLPNLHTRVGNDNRKSSGWTDGDLPADDSPPSLPFQTQAESKADQLAALTREVKEKQSGS